MAIPRPFRRTARPFMSGYYNSGDVRYVMHPKFARDPDQYIRAFLLLQADMKNLFEYIEPSDQNLCCYSYRIHALLIRLCIEIEANFRAILLENGYNKRGNLTIVDFSKVNKSHGLASFLVRMPFWYGSGGTRAPFLQWTTGSSLDWYQAYNKAKHDRHEHFSMATFENTIDAMCALVTLISAQFIQEDFGPDRLATRPVTGFELATGDYFQVRFPNDWPEGERYDFNWRMIENDPDPFQQFTF
jgi:hypothetical protein